MIKQEEVKGVWVVTVSGIATPNDFDRVVPRMKETLSSGKPLRMVIDALELEGMTFGGWVREIKELIRLLPYRSAPGRCAFFSKKAWSTRILNFEDWLMPNMEYQAFTSEEREEAIEWAST